MHKKLQLEHAVDIKRKDDGTLSITGRGAAKRSKKADDDGGLDPAFS